MPEQPTPSPKETSLAHQVSPELGEVKKILDTNHLYITDQEEILLRYVDLTADLPPAQLPISAQEVLATAEARLTTSLDSPKTSFVGKVHSLEHLLTVAYEHFKAGDKAKTVQTLQVCLAKLTEWENEKSVDPENKAAESSRQATLIDVTKKLALVVSKVSTYGEVQTWINSYLSQLSPNTQANIDLTLTDTFLKSQRPAAGDTARIGATLEGITTRILENKDRDGWEQHLLENSFAQQIDVYVMQHSSQPIPALVDQVMTIFAPKQTDILSVKHREPPTESFVRLKLLNGVIHGLILAKNVTAAYDLLVNTYPSWAAKLFESRRWTVREDDQYYGATALTTAVAESLIADSEYERALDVLTRGDGQDIRVFLAQMQFESAAKGAKKQLPGKLENVRTKVGEVTRFLARYKSVKAVRDRILVISREKTKTGGHEKAIKLLEVLLKTGQIALAKNVFKQIYPQADEWEKFLLRDAYHLQLCLYYAQKPNLSAKEIESMFKALPNLGTSDEPYVEVCRALVEQHRFDLAEQMVRPLGLEARKAKCLLVIGRGKILSEMSASESEESQNWGIETTNQPISLDELTKPKLKR